jgi:glycosyltransferase involved in cell wall biosynthesis
MLVGMTTFGGDGGRSGIGRYVSQLVRTLPEAGPEDRFEIMVHASERGAFVEPEAGVDILEFPGTMSRPISDVAWHQIGLPLVAAWRRFDVLFLPAGNRRLPAWCPCPTVGTVHDFSSLHVPGKYDSSRMTYIRRVLPALMRRLDHVITPSESSRRDVIDTAGVPPEKVTVTPLGVDLDRFHPMDPLETGPRLAAGLGISQPFILYVSRIEHPGKNHVRLIRAFSRLKVRTGLPHLLVLAGPDWFRSEAVHREAASSPVCRDIRFAGHVSANELTDLYAAADAFVFPSLYEGFGLPVLEAMACGTPVACADTSSLPEVAGDAAVLFHPEDEDSMADAIESILGDPARRAALVAAGMARAREYTWERTALATMEVLRGVAARRLC